MLGALFSGLANIAQTLFVNKTNTENVERTNQANIKQVQMQNEAQRKESELAYNRSKASNQVSLMQSAGMSKAGAISALNGGGSYTPAPVNAAQSAAPQNQTADLSALANVGQLAMQRQINSDAIDYSKDKKMIKSILDKLSNNADWYHGGEDTPTIKELYSCLSPKQREAMTNPLVREQVIQFIDSSYRHRKEQHDIFNFVYDTNQREYQKRLNELDQELREYLHKGRIDTEEKKLLAEKARARLEEMQNNISADAFEAMDKETLQRYAETRATLEWLSHIGEMSAEKVIDKLRTIVGL